MFQLDFQFLDLHDLNDNDKNHLIGILKSNVANDTLKLPWDTVESGNDVNASITEIPQVHNQWYHNGNSFIYLFIQIVYILYLFVYYIELCHSFSNATTTLVCTTNNV